MGEFVNEVPAPTDHPRRPSGVTYPVIVRLVLADGSEQWRPGKTVRWTQRAVYVSWETTPEQSRYLTYAWLPVADDRRVIRGQQVFSQLLRGTTAVLRLRRRGGCRYQHWWAGS